MQEPDVKLAQLSDEQLERVQALEDKLGDNVVLLAYDRPLQPATLSPEQVDEVMQLELEMPNAYLVAYRKPKAPGA